MESQKELTRAEEQLMQVLWELKRGFVKDVIDRLPEPKPAYNTVSTIIRILETKGFVDHKAYGKSHEYFPLISKEEYRSGVSDKLLDNYFGSSVKQLLSFFARREKIDLNEADEILKIMEDIKKQQS
ncbi:MAG: BlaI/MecI/CopY family transcriptional regulator [Mucilaginibacter polytrichastri]|nr:BlaI/MecI/CopY family transcriptional regulator [Mucilaginibacter polytrichastri]